MLKNHLSKIIIGCAITVCLISSQTVLSQQHCPVKTGKLNAADLEIAKHAWKYFENNTQTTGLVNSAHNYPSTTMWDTGSSLAALISAHQAGLVNKEKFDKQVSNLLKTLKVLDLFNGEAPNKVYNTKTAQKVDYVNKVAEYGIGVSTLDLGRLASWLNILSCLYPQYQAAATEIIMSWNYCRLIKQGQMFGMARNKKNKRAILLQEGRLGYEQYAAKVFARLGFDLHVSAKYRNRHAIEQKILETPILVDKRDSKTLGAYNYVVSESYAMDAVENGVDAENKPLLNNIYIVQRKRWEKTGHLTAVSEDNIDRAPYFIYNTIFTDDQPWKALTDRGEDMAHLKTLSVKAALSMAYLFPERPYSKKLLSAVTKARNPKGGWYSGIYEDKKLGFNKATTANTNGVVLSLMAWKIFGPLNEICTKCKKGISLSEQFLADSKNQHKCRADLPKLIAKGKEHSKAFNKKVAASLKAQKAAEKANRVKSIWALVGMVKEAERLNKTGNVDSAVSTIESVKGKAWKLGDLFSYEKKAFRGLMQPLDTIAKKWHASKSSDEVTGVRKSLTAIALRVQEKEKASHKN
ncbi:MAG: DUF3131 domain-containing protein [Pseudomonadota bacterium]